MSVDSFVFDGKYLKAISFGSSISDAYYTSRQEANLGSNALRGFTAQMAYNTVAYAFRCVTKRAEECSRVPFIIEDESGRDVTEDPQYESLVPTKQLLFDLEVSRCLYGAAYAVITANLSGYNVGLEWVATPSIRPNYDPMTQKVRWFERTAPIMITLQLNQIVYIWNRNYADENKPGLGETQVALGASSTLFALDATLARYLNAGAVPVWLVPVEPSTQDDTIKREQNFYNKMVSGINNSWRYIVARMQKDRMPVKLGSDIKEMEAKELSESMKESIAEAHSIPPNIVSGEYKYATADSEYLSFVAGTIVPRVEQTICVMNEQYYKRYGLKIVLQPKKMEIFQASFLEQAQAVSQLVDGKPLTLDEGRAILELGPMVETETLPVPVIVSSTSKPLPLNEDGTRPQPIDGKPKPLQLSTASKPVPLGNTPVPVKALMEVWRAHCINVVKAGDDPSTTSRPPVPDVDAIANELKGLKTGKSVRAVFAKYWPRDESESNEVKALNRASDVLERLMEVTV